MRRFALLLLATLCLVRPATSVADEKQAPTAVRNPIRLLHVPGDSPSDWPPGPWVPVPSSRLQQKISQLADAPPSVWIQESHYHATFQKAGILSGRMTADLQARSTAKETPHQLIPWLDANLSFAELAWPKSSADLGISPSGETFLIVPRGATRLSGEWSRRGRGLTDGHLFEIKLPPAAINELTLDLPRGFVLRTSPEFKAEREPSPQATYDRWTIHAGSRTSLQLLVLEERDLREAAGTDFFFQLNTSFAFSRDEFRVRQEILIEAPETPLDVLKLTVPQGLEIRQVSLGNTQLNHWTMSANEPRELMIPFTEPIQGLSRPLTIVGTLSAGRDQLIELTEPRPVRGVPLSEQVTLNILAPLELRTIQAGGYRQVAVSTAPGISHSLIYQRLDPSSRIKVNVGLPPNIVRVDVATRLDVRTMPASAQCDLLWKMSSGETYELPFRLAAGWSVESLEIIRADDSQPGSKPDWYIKEQHPDGSRSIGVELTSSLSPEQPQSLHLELRRSTEESSSPIATAIVTPLSAQIVECYLAMSESKAFTPPRDFGLREVDLAELPAEIRALRSFKDIPPSAYRFFSFGSEMPAGVITGETALQSPSGWEVEVEVGETEIVETIRCRLPENSPHPDRAYLSMPLNATQWSWSVEGSTHDLNPAAIDSSLTGGLSARQAFEIVATPPFAPSAILVGTRRVPVGSEYHVGLPAPIDATPFTGRIEIRDPQTALLAPESNLVLRERNLELLADDSEAGVYRAEYDSADAGLSFVPELVSHAARKELVGHLRSVARFEDGWHLHHEFELNLPVEAEIVRLRIPAGLQLNDARVNDRPVRVTGNSTEPVSISLGTAGTPHVLSLQFQTALSSSVREFDFRFPLPELPDVPHRVTWELSLPSDWELSVPSSGILVHTPMWQPSWSERCFGSLGRSSSERLFNPFQPSEWKWSSFTETADEHVVAATASNEIPPDWKTWNLSISSMPESVHIRGWSRGLQQRLAWVAFFLSLSIGVILRRIRNRFRAGIGAIWLAAIVAVISFVSPRWVESAGSLLTGSLIAAILPRSLIFGRKPVTVSNGSIQIPTGSTVTRHPAVTAFLISICLVSAGLAQNPSAQNPAARDQPFDVLVPYTAFPPSEELPQIVYLREADYARLFPTGETADESVLLLSGDYHCEISDEGFARLTARYEFLLADGQIERLRLPLRGANLSGDDSCKVNGVATSVTIDDRGEFVVLLPANLPEAPSDAVNEEIAEAALRSVVVELALYPPVSVDQQDRFFEINLPIAPSNHVTAKLSSDIDAELYLKSDDDELVESTNRRELDVPLGRVSSFRLGWRASSADRPAVESKPKLDVSALVFAEARLTYMVYRVRATHSAAEGAIQEIDWTIPANWSLRSLSAPGVLQHRLFKRKTGERRLIFDLRDPIAPGSEPLIVDATFLCPTVSSEEDEVTCSIPDIFNVGDQMPFYQAGKQQVRVGIWSPPELSLAPFEIPSDRLRLFPAEEFQLQWPADAQLQLPRFSYEVQQLPVEAAYLYTTTRPRRQVKGVQIKGNFKDDTLEWSWTGEVLTSDTPAFQHEFRIDPRLEIVSVSVKEDRAERVSRWSVQSSQLTILLNRKTEGRQLIEIKGSLPLAAAEEFFLPQVRLLQADSTPSDLELSQSGEWSIVLPESPENLLRPDEGVPPQAQETRPIARYQLSDRAELPVLRLDRLDAGLAVQRMASLRLRADGNFDLVVVFESEVTASTDRLRIRIPAEFADRYTLNTENLEFQSADDSSGELIAESAAAPALGSSVRVDFRATLEPPSSNKWTLRLPELVDGRIVRDRFACRASEGWLPTGLAANEPASSPIPSVPISSTGEAICDVKDHEIVLGRSEAVRSEIVPKIPVSLTWARIDRGERVSGKWQVLYEGSGLAELRLRSSRPIATPSCSVDGYVVTCDFDSETSEMIVPLPVAGGVVLIEVEWRSVERATTTTLEQVTIPTPIFETLSADQSECVLVYGSELRELMHQGLQRVPLPVQQYRLLAELKKFLPTSLADTPGSSVASDRLRNWAADLRQALESHDRPRLLKDLSAYGISKDNLETLLGDLSLLSPIVRSDAVSPELPGFSSGLSLPNDRVIGTRVSAGTVPKLWFVEERKAAILVAVFLLAISIPLFRWIFRLQTGEWLNRHRPVAWLLLGLLWWIGLRLSAFGAFLTAIAVIFWIVRPTPPVVQKTKPTAMAR